MCNGFTWHVSLALITLIRLSCVFLQICADLSECGPLQQLLLQVGHSLCPEMESNKKEKKTFFKVQCHTLGYISWPKNLTFITYCNVFVGLFVHLPSRNDFNIYNVNIYFKNVTVLCRNKICHMSVHYVHLKLIEIQLKINFPFFPTVTFYLSHVIGSAQGWPCAMMSRACRLKIALVYLIFTFLFSVWSNVALIIKSSLYSLQHLLNI